MKKLTSLFIVLCLSLIFIGCGEKFDLSFAKTSFELTVGEEVELNPTVTGESDVEYSFDKEGIIEVVNNKAKALSEGEVVVTAFLKSNKNTKVTITFTVVAHVHDYEEVVDAKFLASAATCQTKAKYYKSCSCGEMSDDTFESGDFAAHKFDQEVADEKYFVGTGTSYLKAKYYKSCVCGEHNEETFEIDAAQTASENVYVNSNVLNADVKTKVTYLGEEYVVGVTAFATLEDAIKYATKNIFIENYELDNEFTLTKSGLNLIGDNSSFKVLSKLNIGDEVSNITLEKIVFGENSQVWGIGNNENITIDNCNFDGNKSDSSKATVYFAGSVKNLVVKNSSFIEAICARSIRTASSLENLTVDNCKFGGPSSYDPIRTDSTLSGNITITNCVFDGTEQSGIMIRTHSSGNYVIKNNKFYNIVGSAIWIKGKTGSPCNSKFEIKYNIFDNSEIYSAEWDKDSNWGCIGLEANDYTKETLQFDVNYNQFIDWGTYLLCDNTEFGLVCANFDYNYFSTKVEGSYFDNIAKSYNHIFETIEDLEVVLKYKDINESDDNTLIVGSNENVTKTTYATIDAALKKAKDGSTIYILPGTYNENIKIKFNNLTIKTLNSEIDPTSENRNNEVVFTGKITIDSKVSNLSISGIRFENEAKIVNIVGLEGTAANTDVNLDGFEFKNNYVKINHTSGNGFIEFSEVASSYSHNIKITNNYFTTESTNASKAVIYLDNVYNLVLEENKFENITGNAFYVTDTTKGLSGEYSKINSNSFKNISDSAIHINWMSPLPLNSSTGYIEIENNDFDTVGKNAIYIGKANNSDSYQSIKIMFNKFKSVNNGVYIERVQKIYNISAKYNTFYDEPTGYYFFNNSKNTETTTPATLDATMCIYYNGEKVVTPNSQKFSELVEYEPNAKKPGELPSYDDTATEIEIKEIELFVGDTKKLEVIYTPSNTVSTGVTWYIDNSSIATIDQEGNITALKEGKVVVKAVYNYNNKVMAELEIEIEEYKSIEVRYGGNSIIAVGNTLQLNTDYINCSGNVVYTSLTPEIAAVDANGLVTALKDGQALISVKLANTDIETKVGITVANISSYSALMQKIVGANNENVMYRTINYIGYEANYLSVAHKIYGSVNAYYASENPEIQKNMLSTDAENYDDREMKSIEFIVVHDTGAAAPSSTAYANSKWCTNASNTGSSWHYTVGNDGIYQQIDEKMYAWHAGDKTDWGTTTVFSDTGVAFDGYRPEVTISSDGYFVINGKKTTLESPKKEDGTVETRTNELGLLAVKGDNGNYWLPTTWISSQYGNVVCIRGGNINGIGIESAVNTGSDVYLTWQYLAKFVASLLVKHDLLPDRVAFHNNFANKPCPNTMISNGLVEMFLEMVEVEYEIAKEYSEYKIEFISNNPDVIDNTGRIINQPDTTQNVSYTVKITKGNTVEELTLNAIVPGTKTLK